MIKLSRITEDNQPGNIFAGALILTEIAATDFSNLIIPF